MVSRIALQLEKSSRDLLKLYSTSGLISKYASYRVLYRANKLKEGQSICSLNQSLFTFAAKK